MNYEKIKNWTKFWVAFTNYVSNNKRSILLKESITMEDIIMYSFKKSGSKLNKYFEERKKLFSPEVNTSENIDWTVTDSDINKTFKQILR